MKNNLYAILTLLALALLVMVAGCDKIEDSVVGSNDDPTWEAFQGMFEMVDESTGQMIGLPFVFMDTIVAEGTPQATGRTGNSALNLDTYTLEWHAASNYWYCTATIDDSGTTLSVIDSIQFVYATGPVKYPLFEDSITQIKSFLGLVAAGTGIDTAYAFQNLTVTQDYGLGLVYLNGTGGSNATMSEEGCSVTWDFDLTFNNITWYSDYMWTDGADDELNCPSAGTINYSGTMDGACLADSGVTVSGSWTLEESFNDGLMAWDASDGALVWSGSDACGVGYTHDLLGADTLFVEDLFGNGGTELTLETFDIAFALLEDQGIMPPQASGRQVGLTGTALQDTTIILGSSYTYTNGWHVFTFEAREESPWDTLNIAGIDSIKALIGGVAQQGFDDPYLLDALHNHAHLSITNNGVEGMMSASMHHLVAATINIAGAGTSVIFNGSANDTLEVVSGVGEGNCEVAMTVNQTVTNLTINPEVENVCPSAGSVATTFGVDMACSQLASDLNEFVINGSWTVTATANGNNTMTVSFDNGDVHWSVTGDCASMSSPYWLDQANAK